MRVFIGIQLTSEWLEELEKIQREVKSISSKGNFTRKENIHLTICFIGEIEAESLKLWKEQFASELMKYSTFKIETAELNFFTKKKGNIPWVGIEENSSLQKVYDAVSDILLQNGSRMEFSNYTPHLTLGRNVRWRDVEFLQLKQKSFPKLSQTVTQLTLFQSHQVKGELRYTPLAVFPLQNHK